MPVYGGLAVRLTANVVVVAHLRWCEIQREVRRTLARYCEDCVFELDPRAAPMTNRDIYEVGIDVELRKKLAKHG